MVRKIKMVKKNGERKNIFLNSITLNKITDLNCVSAVCSLFFITGRFYVMKMF